MQDGHPQKNISDIVSISVIKVDVVPHSKRPSNGNHVSIENNRSGVASEKGTTAVLRREFDVLLASLLFRRCTRGKHQNKLSELAFAI